jgi:seryl-tRNA synthetase
MPIDINELRDYKGRDPAKWKTYMEQRFKDPTIVDQGVLHLDMDWCQLRSTADSLRKEVGNLQRM